ncbi:MAG: hypothetical protein IJN43_14660 [Ruminococcus sp.]|nr:hypothetical protein [Ruminococcus sp.]
MDEYCGYEVDDVYSGEVLDEVMCEVCGTIQPVENKICSYCGAKIQSKEAKKARKKKRKKESGDYVPARKKINRKPPSKPAAENTMEKPKPMEKPTPMERPKPIERPTPIVKPKPAESPKPVDSFAQRLAEIHNSVEFPESVVEKPMEMPEDVEFPESVVEKPMAMPEDVEFPESVVEKPMAMPEDVEFPESIVEKPMAMPEDVEFPESVVEKPMAMPEDVEFPESVVEKPMAMPEEVEFPESVVEKPMAMPEEVEFPESIVEKPMAMPEDVEFPESVVEKPMAMPEEVEFPQSVVEKPMEMPKPVELPKPAKSPKPMDSFAQRLAEIHNSVKLPEDVADDADEADFEMPDVLDRTPRHSVSINKPDLQKPEPIINPPRPAVSISNMNSRNQDNSPLMSRGIDGEERYSEEDLSDDLPMDDYIDEGENEKERLKLALKLTAIVLFIMIGIVVMVEAAELKSRHREKMNLSNYSAPVTYYDDGNVSLDFEDQELLEVGKDFPADEYFFSGNDTYGGGVVVWDSKIEDVLCVADVDNSLYLTLKEGQFLMSVNCDMYRLEKSFKENNPFACPGMFKVGFDLEAGTYNVVPYGNAGQPCVRVHKKSVYDMDSFLGNFLPENGKIKVKKGDYLELDNCILEKNE